MNFDQLRYFLEAARFEHVGKAARSLGISQSAVSHSIAALEEELGKELFQRRGKKVFLNAHGKFLEAKARGLLEEAVRIREELASDAIEFQGHYRLGATHLICASYLTPAWVALQRRHPRLTAEITSLRSAQVLSAVVAGELDFGLCLGPQPHPEVAAEPIHSGQLRIVVRSGHPILKLPLDQQLRQLSGIPAVLAKAFQGIELCERSHPMFGKFGIKPVFDCLIDSLDVAIEKIARPDSWGFLPDWVVASHPRRLRALEMPPGWKAGIDVMALYRKNGFIPKALRELVVSAREQFQAGRMASG